MVLTWTKPTETADGTNSLHSGCDSNWRSRCNECRASVHSRRIDFATFQTKVEAMQPIRVDLQFVQGMSVHLSPTQVEALLGELCVVLGFCLPPDEQVRLCQFPPTDSDSFTDAVISAEGLDPYAGVSLHLRRDIKARIAKHFKNAEDEEQFG